jgi:aryl-alcohol dehydrogenase-like predicted oxidoreductase
MADGPNRKGLSRKHIFDACDASLKRLNMDYIDLYQIHRLDKETPIGI